MKKDMRGILEFVIKSYKKIKEGTKRHISYFNKPLPFSLLKILNFHSPLKTLTFGRQERREKRATVFREKEEKREKRRFFSSCPYFIKGLIPLHLWSDRAEIWRRVSWLIYLQSERWRSDSEFWKVIRKKEEKREKCRFFSSCPNFIRCPIPLRPWFDWVEIWRRGLWLMYLQYEQWKSNLEFCTVIREKEEKREKRRFFASCPDFIKGPMSLCPWSNRAEIWRRCSQLVNLQFERWRSDLEFRKVIF